MKPVVTAICSFGLSGRAFHAPFIDAHEGFQLYAVWERSIQKAAHRYPDIKSFPSLEQMLADPAIELVVVNTPNYSHYDYATEALKAGKHVIVEKPFTVTESQAAGLMRLAGESGLILSVYQNRRWDSDFQLVRQVYDEKLLGTVMEAEFHFDRFNEQLSPKAHKESPGPGTGVLYDLGSHLIDQALLLFGFPAALFADLAVMRPLSRIPDYMELLLYYENRRVRLKSGYFVKEPVPAFALHGTKGSFLKVRADIQEAELEKGKIPGTLHWGEEPPGAEGLLHTGEAGEHRHERIPAPAGNYMAYYEGIFQAIRNGKAVPVTAEDAKQVIRLIEAAQKSSDEKQVIYL